MDPKQEDKRKAFMQFMKEYNVIISFFYELFFVLFGLILFGLLIDKLANTKILFTVVFSVLGVLSAIYNLYKKVQKR